VGEFELALLSQPTLSHYLVLGAILFAVSVIGIFLNRRNVIIILMAIELMLLAVNLNFIAFSHYLNDTAGQIFVFFILTVAAAESAIGLAILVLLFRNVGSIDVEDLRTLRG
jgi:NADH-quinone oxidoreductase subunit K